MAEPLLGPPTDKDDFLEALSKREGAIQEAAACDAADSEPAGSQDGDGDAPPSADDGGEDRASLDDFINAPDTDEAVGEDGAEDEDDVDEQETIQHLLRRTDTLRVEDSYCPALSTHDRDPLHGLRQPGGIVATYRDSEQLQQSLGVQRSLKGVDRLKRDYAAKTEFAEDAKSALADEEEKLRGLKRQAEAGRLEDPARLSYQEREVSKAWDRLTERERARDAAELALHRAGDDAEIASRNVAQEASHHDHVAKEKRDIEIKRAKRALSQDAAARAAARERQKAIDDQEARKAAEARRHQAMGARRLQGTHAAHKDRLEELEQVRENRFQHDAQRVLQLKGSIDGIKGKLQSSNEARRKKQHQVKADREARKQQMLNDGQNPYEVWRREEMDAEKERQQTKLKALNEMRSEKLLEQLMTEERTYKKKRDDEKKRRAEADVFQKEMGSYAKEKKIAAYIRKMTIGNVDVLDPTGTALRIDPSKVTVQKTHAFGLGRAPASEIDKVTRDLGRSKRLLGTRRPTRPDSANSLDSRDLGPTIDVTAQAVDDDPHGDPDKEELPEGKLWVPRLTKLEQQYLDDAMERQKQNITSVQRCWGKEFKGDAFLAKPSVIAFDDFEVGQRYRQIIEVTNVSLTFNQFKLLPLDDKVKDFFEIQFQPPGRMSAGVTRYITLWFCPKVNTDISTTFPILAKTGRIDFPLRCTTKKTILTVTPQDADANPVIDFGQVLAGESGTCVLQVRNTGAIPAAFEIEPEEPESECVKMLSWKPGSAEFKEHGMTKISFTFKPGIVGAFATSMKLAISNGAAGDALYSEEKRILVRGSCVDVPIYVEKETYDLKTCVFGHIFRETIIVHNRRSVPMKIEVEKPKQIEGELQINPVLAYIQGNKEQAIQVRFCPTVDFLDKNQQYRDVSRRSVPGAFRIPVRVVGADQVLPVHTALVGTLTSSDIRFEPSVVDFGRCFVGASVMSRLLVINESLLPQRFVFVRLPGILSVAEVPVDVCQEEAADGKGGETAVLDSGVGGGCGVLLPKERRQLCITYSPDAATETNVKLLLKAIAGQLCAQEFTLQCKGQGVSPLLALSSSNVEMASIPCNVVSKESVIISNVSKVPYVMHMILPPPELSGLKATPVCCTLAPGQSQRLQLEFKPTEEYVNLLHEPPKTPEEGEGEGGDAEAESPPEPKASSGQFKMERLRDIRTNGGRRWEGTGGRTVHASWKLPICMRVKAAKPEQTAKKEQIMYLGISTCVLPEIVTATPAVLDFGQVTAQQRRILPLTLQAEAGVEPQDLIVEALPEIQCFTVLNASRTISGKPFRLMIEFHPRQVQIYQSVLQLRTQSTHIQVPLRGRGVRPVLKIEPEDGVLRLGSLVHSKESKDSTKKEFVIRNDSPFELSYSLETVVPADENYVGPPCFTLTPATGVVEANGSRTVLVTFRPHRPLALFREKVLVNVPNQKEPTYLYLYGHCFKYQVYAMPGMTFGPFGRAETRGPSAFVDALSVGIRSGANPETGEFSYPQAQQTEFSLAFGKEDRTQFLLIGASVGAAPGNFDFQIQQSDFSKYFTVEAPEAGAKPDKAAKGAVKPGELPIKVLFKYSPDEKTSLKYGDVQLDLLGGIGQWITCKVKGVLSGGVVPQGEPPTQEITVELRAYLEQI